MAKVTSIKDYFSSGQGAKKYKEAQEKAKNSTSYGQYEDGKYNAQLVMVKTNNSEASGRFQAVLSFRFTSGEYKGKSINKYMGLEEGMEYLLKDLKILGYDNPDADEIESSVFKELNKTKPVVKIRLKTKEGTEYQNVYLIGIEKEESEEKDVDDTEAVESTEAAEEVEAANEDNVESGEEAPADEAVEANEDAEEKPKIKKAKKAAVVDEEFEEEPSEEEAEEPEEEDADKLDVGSTVIAVIDGKRVKGEVTEIVSENKKTNTGVIRIKSIKTGKKYVVDVPEGIEEVVG